MRDRGRVGPIVDERGTSTLRSFYSFLNILNLLRSGQIFANFVNNFSSNEK